MLLYTAVMTVIAVAINRWCKLEAKVGRALILTTAMMNIGNFGLPLVMFAYGPEALSLSVLTFVLFNFALSSYAIVVAQEEAKWPRRSATSGDSAGSRHLRWRSCARPPAGLRRNSSCVRWNCSARPPCRSCSACAGHAGGTGQDRQRPGILCSGDRAAAARGTAGGCMSGRAARHRRTGAQGSDPADQHPLRRF
ncbi:MAG: hypothetical protein MZU79_01235 [Anaerotruncus sp.]|nr:hypothetical protein [Anaerotruncus sp.]